MLAGTIAACVMATLALIGLTRQWLKDRRARDEDLNAVVNQRLKELLDHYDGVFEEYERRARELTGHLGDARKENRKLREAAAQVEPLRRRVAELERQVGDLETEIAALRGRHG